MKMHLALTVLLAAAVSMQACARPVEEAEQEPTPQASTAADEDAIRALVEDFDAAMNAEDLDALLAGFVAEPTTLPPGGPSAVGAEAFRRVWGGLVEQGDVQVDNVAEQIWVDGDMAVGWGNFSLTIQPEDGPPVVDAGKWMAVWRRQADGSWKAVANIWNSDTQPGAGG